MQKKTRKILNLDKFVDAIEELARSELVKNFNEGGRYGDGMFGGGITK
jgi:hypothetical protein